MVFTLFLGFLGLCAMERYAADKRRMALWLVGLLAVSIVLHADYGCIGYGFILMLYVLRRNRIVQAVVGTSLISGIHWMGGVLKLDFGVSYSNGREVTPQLWLAFTKTLQLALASMIWIIIVTPLLGLGAAAKPRGAVDQFTRIYCLCGTAIPTFVLGFILIRLFCVKWGVFPAVSDGTLKCLILPSFTLSLSHIAYFVQMLRKVSEMKMGC